MAQIKTGLLVGSVSGGNDKSFQIINNRAAALLEEYLVGIVWWFSRTAMEQSICRPLISIRLSVDSSNFPRSAELKVVVRQMSFPLFQFAARGDVVAGVVRLHTHTSQESTSSSKHCQLLSCCSWIHCFLLCSRALMEGEDSSSIFIIPSDGLFSLSDSCTIYIFMLSDLFNLLVNNLKSQMYPYPSHTYSSTVLFTIGSPSD